MCALQVQTPEYRYEQFARVLHICATCTRAAHCSIYWFLSGLR